MKIQVKYQMTQNLQKGDNLYKLFFYLDNLSSIKVFVRIIIWASFFIQQPAWCRMGHKRNEYSPDDTMCRYGPDDLDNYTMTYLYGYTSPLIDWLIIYPIMLFLSGFYMPFAIKSKMKSMTVIIFLC